METKIARAEAARELKRAKKEGGQSGDGVRYEHNVLDQKMMSMRGCRAEEGQFDGEEDGKRHDGDTTPKERLPGVACWQRSSEAVAMRISLAPSRLGARGETHAGHRYSTKGERSGYQHLFKV